MIMQKIKITLTIIFLSHILFANDYDFKNYTVVDGLSESTINVIFEDKSHILD